MEKRGYIAEEIIIGMLIFVFLIFEFGLKKFINVFYMYFGFVLVNLFFIVKIAENIIKLKNIKKWEKS